MRVLLDECLPRRLKQELTGRDAKTVPEMGWAGLKNGELLQVAAGQFEAFITVDRNLPGCIGPRAGGAREHNYFYGWVVSVKRAGHRWVGYFSDRLGGRMAALHKAREHRDKLLAGLPRPTKIKRTYVRNTTGVVGVARVKERTRAGRIIVRYVASLPRRNGRTGKASFSIGLYGEAQAKRFAIRARRQAVAEFVA